LTFWIETTTDIKKRDKMTYFEKLKNLTLTAASSKSEYTKIKKLTPKDAARKPLKSHRVLNILAAT